MGTLLQDSSISMAAVLFAAADPEGKGERRGGVNGKMERACIHDDERW